ncbi:MAG: periplasmic heavy metal sensor [Burkholderiales bacterium]
MNIIQNLLSKIVVLAFAFATGTLAFAQGPGGPPPHGGPGHPPAPPLAMLLLDTDVVSSLALTSAQTTAWAALSTAEQAARSQGDDARTAVDALVSAQFGSGTPDLVAIEKAMANAHQAMAAAMANVSAQAIACYATLNTGQQAIVVAAAIARYQQAQQH